MFTCLYDVDMFTSGRIVLCRLELAYFAGKISKNRLVCKNAVALAYYGRPLVMGSGKVQSAYEPSGLSGQRQSTVSVA